MAGVRRTWDKDYYEKRARDRAEQGDSFEEEDATNAGNKAKARRIIKACSWIVFKLIFHVFAYNLL